jgi:methyl-accepting chemotaxis protein
VTKKDAMAKDLTNVHSKLDRLLQRMSKFEAQQATMQRRSDVQTRLMIQMLAEVSKMSHDVSQATREISQATREISQATREISQQTADLGTLVAETLRTVKQSDERITELLASSRKH